MSQATAGWAGPVEAIARREALLLEDAERAHGGADARAGVVVDQRDRFGVPTGQLEELGGLHALQGDVCGNLLSVGADGVEQGGGVAERVDTRLEGHGVSPSLGGQSRVWVAAASEWECGDQQV